MDLALRVLAILIGMFFGFCGLLITSLSVLLAPTPADSAPPVVVPVVTPATPTPAPEPSKPAAPKRRSILPWNAGDPFSAAQKPENAVVGGLTSPDGSETVMLDLQPHLRLKNTGGRGPGGPGTGAGLCVFTSINHAAFLQNVRCLQDLQKRMTTEPGGGYPEKVDAYLRKFCPDIIGKYTQVTDLHGTPEDLAFLRDVLSSGRIPCITYDGTLDPHYGYRHIEHMLNVVHVSDKWAAILDNNFIGDNQIVWMKPAALAWMLTSGHTRTGWCVVLHAPGRLPIPHNGGGK